MKILNFISLYKSYILISLVLIFMYRSCSKASTINKLTNKVKVESNEIDSLLVVNKDTVNCLILNHKKDLQNINSWIIKQPRTPQLIKLNIFVDSLLKKIN